MAEDEHAIRSKIAEHHAKLNTVSLTSRILIEAGLSECPFGTGETPADIDLSRLMAKASTIFYLGGYSDAIHYGGMKPEVRISPAGQVLIDPAFFDVIVEPAGRSLADKVIDEHRDRYTELLRKPDLETRPLDEIVEGEFLEAWQAEVGASLADCRGAVEARETKLVDAGVGWEMMPRPELVAFLDDHIRDPEAYVAALESVPQKGWKSVPNPFVDQGRQPWRFGRRLSVYRRRLMRLSNFNNALVVVVPGFLRASLLMMMHNYYGAGMDQELLISRKCGGGGTLSKIEMRRTLINWSAQSCRRWGGPLYLGRNFLRFSERDYCRILGTSTFWRGGPMVGLSCLSAKIYNLPERQAKLRSNYSNTRAPWTKKVDPICLRSI